jgi:hypothetical protein
VSDTVKYFSFAICMKRRKNSLQKSAVWALAPVVAANDENGAVASAKTSEVFFGVR